MAAYPSTAKLYFKRDWLRTATNVPAPARAPDCTLKEIGLEPQRNPSAFSARQNCTLKEIGLEPQRRRLGRADA